MLEQMRQMSSGVPSKQMAAMMRCITECYKALESLEGQAQAAYVQATGFALKNMPFLQQKEPQPSLELFLLQRQVQFSGDFWGFRIYPMHRISWRWPRG
jgi:hypothetical protein